MDRTEQLAARLDYLAAAVESSHDAVLGLALDGFVHSWNRAARRLFGLSDDRMREACVADLIADSDSGAWEASLALATSGDSVEHVEIAVRRRDESVICTQLTATPVLAADGSVLGVSAVFRDVDEQRLAQATLADSAQRVAQSEALAHVGSWAWDALTDAVQWSEEQHRIHGISPREFGGTLSAQLELAHPDDRDALRTGLQEALLESAPFAHEFRVIRPDGSVRWVSARASVVAGGTGESVGLRGIYHDITERHESALVLEEANERLTQLALYDRLTGLPNRLLLMDRLGRSLGRRRQDGMRVDLMYIGVDDFKTINDSAGHSAGDQVLMALAPLLDRAVRQVGQPQCGTARMLARLGGDEFAILLDDADPQAIAQSIQFLLEQPLQLPEDQVFITVSIGDAHVSPAREEVTPEVVIAEANIAMHEAKRAGKARYLTFEPRMHEAARLRHRLGHELHQALAQDQFTVRYQPVIDLPGGQVIGAEALVRWEHPTLGLVGPNNFIPRAEETGLIVALGAWVLRQACEQAVAWQGELGRPLTIAVNVSGRQLREPDFVETVRGALRESGLAPELLCLEVTESILMEGDVLALAMFTKLREDGVHLAIDDFGTGYSSLAALRRLPFDQLKIDRSFVAGLPSDDDAATIAWAIVHLGHTLGLTVLAEGIETHPQRAELLRFGCNHGQGYLFGPGIPSQDLVALAARPTWPLALDSGDAAGRFATGPR